MPEQRAATIDVRVLEPGIWDSIAAALRDRATRTPDRTAYVFLAEGEEEQERLTYAGLDARARAIAAALSRSVAPGERALLLYPPGLDFVAAFFGCLYAGVIAVPAYPPRSPRSMPRLLAILADAEPAVALAPGASLRRVRGWLERTSEGTAVSWIATDEVDPAPARFSPPAPDGDAVAFLQYTSGSTSTPKGVMVSHANLVSNQRVIEEACSHSEESVFVSWLPVYHDLGLIGNLLQAVWVGALCVLMAPVAFLQNPLRWPRAVSRYRGTTSGGPNFAYDLCARRAEEASLAGIDLSSWRVAFNGAEPVLPKTLERFAAAFAPHGFRAAASYPCYGLAEATLMVSGGSPADPPRVESFLAAALERGLAEPAEPGGPGARSLAGCGRPLGDQAVVVVHPEMAEPLPSGRIGEIWIAGPSVARGYWKRPEETAEVFGARLAGSPGRAGEPAFLRTGDLGFLHGGELYVTGRIKDLIILRGRNFYPQDLELTAGQSHPDLRPGGGAAFSVEAGGEERLVLVHEVRRRPRADVAEIAAAIRAAVAEEHEAAVSDVVLLHPETLPRTSSGKVRRRACREAYADGELSVFGRSAAADEASATAAPLPGRADLLALAKEERRALLRESLRRRVAGALGIEPARVPLDETPGRLGLDSLGAAELSAGFEAWLEIPLPVADLLADMTLADLAERVLVDLAENRKRESSRVARDAGEEPASFEQERLWRLDRLKPGNPAWHLPVALDLAGCLDPGLLQRALNELARRHEALRTAFAEVEGSPVQRIAKETALGLPLCDLAALPAAARDAAASHVAEIEAQRPFDLARAPLARALLLRLGSGEHCLLLTVHHAVCDLVSLVNLTRELAEVYGETSAGRPFSRPGPAVRFADFAWEQRRRLSEEILAPRLELWRRRLAGLPDMELPADCPHPGPARPARRTFALPPDVTEGLCALCRGEGATLFMALLAAFDALLHLWTGEDDLVVGCPVAGRSGPGTEGVAGFFAHPLPLRVDLSGDPSFRTLLGRVRRSALEAYAHSEVPFAELAAAARGRGRAPLFRTLLGYLDRPLDEARLPGLTFGPARPGAVATDFEMFLTFFRQGQDLHAVLGYDGSLFAPETMDLWVHSFLGLARLGSTHPDRPLSRLALHPDLAARAQAARARRPAIAVAATFTAEPLEEPLAFWMRELSVPARIRFAPIGQVFQELLDPGSLLARNAAGLNVFLVRFEDWREDAEAAVEELIAALERARPRVPCLLCVAPASPAALADPERAALFRRLEERLAAALDGRSGVLLALPGELATLYSVTAAHDPHADEVGRIPYTPEMYAALATLIARRWARLESPPIKVLVLDCDQTLWKGVCGEDGPQGIEIDPPRRALQELAVDLHGRGVLLCLCSKNNEEDVAEVFARRADMPLRREHIAAERINWRSKSENLRSLSEELRLGLDSFVVLDDDPVVCAEMQAGCPEALVLQLPEDVREIPRFLAHVWAFDTVAATAEDRGRTRLYQQERQRDRLRGASASLADFLAGLGLEVSFPPLTPERLPRVAQLTQRTNQLNATTLRRSEDSVRELCGEGGHEALLAEVRDGFGDYGLVGLAFWKAEGEALRADTFLLSCRALGRGVEHRMLARLGGIARERGLLRVEVPFQPTRKNRPVLEFLSRVGEPFRQPLEEGWLFAFPAEEAAALVYRPELEEAAPASEGAAAAAGPAGGYDGRRASLARRIALELATAERVLSAVRASREVLPASEDRTAPRTPTEELLAGIWEDLLPVDPIGVHADFFDLGGHSLLAAQVASRLHGALGVRLPLATLFEHPTVARLARAVDRELRGGETEERPLLRVPRDRPLPLSFSQERLWFLDRLAPGSAAYNIHIGLCWTGDLSIPALAAALAEVSRRHEALRTTFAETSEGPVQRIGGRPLLELPVVDLTGCPEALREPGLRRLAAAEAQRPFDLERGPLARALLARAGEREHVLFLTLHHIVADGWSMGVLVREMAELYEARVAGRPSSLRELPVQYADFAAWQRSRLAEGALESRLDWWREHLQGAPTLLDLPSDRPRPPVQSFRGRREPLLLAEDLAASLRALGRREGATLYMVLLAAFQILLARHADRDDLLLGSPVAGRGRTELEGLIGFFVNTLALRGDLRGDPTLRELLARTRTATLGAFERQDVPFERLVEELDPDRDLSRNPLFQAMLVLQNTPLPRLEIPGLAVGLLEVDNGTSRFDLTLALTERDGHLAGWLEHSADLFDGATARRMVERFTTLLGGLAASVERLVWELPLQSAAEERQMLLAGIPPRADAPWSLSLLELFAAQAERDPAAPALLFEGSSVSYGELRLRTDRLAAFLRSLGVGIEDRVGLCVEPTPEAIAGLLGILKAGAAYVPLDPAYPAERLALMIADSGVEVVLTQERFRPALSSHPVRLVPLDGDRGLPGEEAPPPPDPALTAAAVYIIYTSGSTGTPKGVVATHRGLAGFAWAMAEAMGLGPGDRVLQFASLSFDASAVQIFPALASGAALVLHRDPRGLSPAEIVDLCRRAGVTVLDLPAALWRQWVAEMAAGGAVETPVRMFLTGGEAVPTAVLRDWAGAVAPAAGFLSSYGPTEATVTTTVFETTRERAGSLELPEVPLGRPLAGARLYLLDRALAPVPLGIPGELFIGGPGVTRGYWRQPARTAGRFLPDPFASEPGARLYRTGDRVQRLADGNLRFLGRADQQVKIRGFRIELGEIESALSRHPEVSEALVIVYEDRPGEKRLVAYVVPPPAARPAPPDLRAWVAARLPEYMVPSAFMLLENLPLTTGGKVDRKALPAPEQPERKSYVAPRTREEEILAALWAQVLRLQRVGVNDNFFELGGDSILSVQIVARARQAGLLLTVRQIFEHPTVAELARYATATETDGVTQAEQGPVVGEVPLTPIQRWFFEQDFADPHHFNQALLLEPREPLVPAALERAMAALVEHHDALRLRFDFQVAAGWRQENAVAEPVAPFYRVDLSGLPAFRLREAFESGAASLQAGFDLSAGPLIRLALFDAGVGQPARLLWVSHHLVVDGVSWRILLEDLEGAYRQAARRVSPTFPPKTTSFQDWARRLAGQAASDLDHWRETARIPVPRLPVDFPEGGNLVGDEATVSFELTAEETADLLQTLPPVYHSRIDEALLSALARALASWTGSPLLRVDLEGHGREPVFDDIDLSRTVGWFTSVYPVVLEAGDAGPGDVLVNAKERLRAVPGHGIDYGLLRSLRDARDGTHEDAARVLAASAAEISFNYLGQIDATLEGISLFRASTASTGPNRSSRARRPYPLEIVGMVADSRLRITLAYGSRMHRPETAERLAAAYSDALRQLILDSRDREDEVFTPSDFPSGGLDVGSFNKLASLLSDPIESIAGGRGLTLKNVEDIYPLSALQNGMLFHSLMAPESGVYLNQLTCTLSADLDPRLFRQVWERLIDRHGALRTIFLWDGLDEPRQVVRKSCALPWQDLDWRGLSADEQRRRFEELRYRDRHTPLPLDRAPLMRFSLIRLDRELRFLWTSHHLLIDGWSLPLLVQELGSAYTALREGREVKLPPTRPFRDYIAWLKDQDLATAEAFWRRTLAGFSTPTPLGIDRPAGARVVASGPSAARTVLPMGATQGLRNFARNLGVTLNTVVQGAWAFLLHRYSGEEDVVFGAVTSGRSAPLPGIESTVGLFINTLPVRVRVERSAVLGDRLRELQDRQAEALRYEYSPLAGIRAWSDVPANRPLFESLIAFESYPIDEALQQRAGLGFDLDKVEVTEQLDSPLGLFASPGEQLSLSLLHDPQRIEAPDAVRLLHHLEGLLTAIPDVSGRTFGELPMLTPAERQEMLADWNDTARATPWRAKAVHHLFEAQVDRSPEAVALVFGGELLTYSDLDRWANRLARHLRALGVEAEKRVGVLLERSADLAVAVLGVLKAEGAYVPLDPAYPAERLEMMAKDAGIRALLTSEDRAGDLPLGDVAVLCLDADREEIGAQSPERLEEAVSAPDQLAYVIYTSGSTGRPKGVQISHGALANFLASMAARPGLEERDTLVAVTSLSFDIAGLEIYLPLLVGARLVLASREEATDGARLRDLLTASGATALQATPATWRLLLDAGWTGSPDLKALCGGEALPPALAAEIRRRTASLWNVYGPTETTIWSTLAPVEEEGPVAIGRPIDNTQAYLLDRWGEPVPPAAPGELFLGGMGVARGYLGRPDLTAERFVPDSFGATPGARLYRTGDLVRYRPDGRLELQGRADHQVKIRGFRIEPGEIEAALESHPGVRETAVVAREDAPGDLRLVAYFVPREGAADEAGLRRFLEERLPRYMVPALFVSLEEMPRLPNGKLNRKALPAPEPRDRQGGTAPRMPLEELVASLFAEVLGAEPGVEDSFFDLGGHSLSAVQLAARLRAVLGVELPVRAIFNASTVAGLARLVEREGAVIEPRREANAGGFTPPDLSLAGLDQAALDRLAAAAPGPIEDLFPASPMQQGMIFHSLRDPGSGVYIEQLRLRLGPHLDPAAFERAWQRVVDHHPALRTAFFWSGLERPLQAVHVGVRLPWERRRGGWNDLLAWQEEDRRQGFDLTRPPLARAVLFDLAEPGAQGGYGFLWSYHHALLDGWSLPILLRDLFALYQEETGQGRAELERARPFRDYIAWLEGQGLAAAEAFWRRSLVGFAAPIPLGIKRPVGSRAAAPGPRAARAGLEPDATEALRNLARGLGVTLNSVVQGAWALLLHRYSGEEDVVFGAVTSGRSAPLSGIESIVGLFINTLPARVWVERSASLGPWLRELQDRQAEALRYEYSPLAEIRAWSDVPAGRPLFESLIAFESYPVDEVLQERAGRELALSDAEITEQLDSPLSLLAIPGERLSLALLHDPQRIEAPDAARLLRHLEGLLAALPAGSGRALGELPALTPAERQELLEGWNSTARAIPWAGRAVHRLFEERVDRSPEAVALVFGGEPFTYRELDRRANRLARYLRALGVEAEARVGILLERSADLVAGVLGVLKAGGAYVPLDPAYPAERLEMMAQDAGIRVLLISADLEAIEAQSPERLEEAVSAPDQLAYVIYTSGSTGRPKGVQISHGALANFLASMAARPGLEERDTLVAVTSLSFDIAGLEIYLPLLVGARLVLASREEATDGARLRDLLTASGATALQATPATWRLLLDAGWTGSPDLKALCGGEALPPALAAEIRRRTASLWNVYGPTETTIWSTLAPVEEEGPVAIGRPIDNTQAYLLDRWGEPVPPAAPGELFLGGMGVARGYLGRPDLTAERFVPDSFGATPGARLYRTGDLVRYRPDGRLELLGRTDHQVKIRGFRIEPGEIEAALESHPGVRETAVVAREDAPGDLRLVAYFVPREGAADEAGLRRFLEERLPRHMVPALFVRLEELPRLPNGKLSRKALPAPETRGRTKGTAPRTPLEELVASLFAEVLHLEPGAEDSFFDLGGHSLSAVQLAARLYAALGVELPVRAIFDAPTVAGLAKIAGRALQAGEGSGSPRLERVPRTGGIPLSFTQQRLWFLDQMDPGNAAYNLFAAFRLYGPLDVPALHAALTETVRRHEALRTTIGRVGGEPVQVIAPSTPVPLPSVDLGGLGASAALREARRLAGLEAGRPFDLERGPLLRQILLCMADGEHAILLTMHHVISDGWSAELLVRELGVLYGAFSRGFPSPLPELEIQYADFAVWQRRWLAGAVLERQLGYWRGRLDGAPPVLALPTDRPRPAAQTFRGAARPVTIPAPLTTALQAFARRRGATLFMTMMAAFQALLSRYAGQDDVSVGLPVAGRSYVETEAIIGFFANTLVLRTELADDQDLAELVARVRDGLLGAYAHQDLPFERLVEELQPERSLSWTPLFQVAFALQSTPLGAVEVPGLRLEPMVPEGGTAKFDLTLLLSESGGGLAGILEYNRDLFDGVTVQRVVEHFLHLLARAVADPELRLSGLPLLSPAELHQRLEWNDTAMDLPRNTTLPELFERQAERAPERTALIFDHREMTYGELARRARALASHLRRLGIVEGALVGVCTEPSFETVVGLLGILRTGAAYVPLDPEYPRERLAAMLEDVPVLLTQARLVERLPATGARIVPLDEIALEGEDDPGPGPRPDSLAYIIYTSGSTGRPKGVMIDHRGAVNTLCDLNLRFGVGPEDRVLALSSLSFDLSVYDLFGLLAAGGAAILAPAGARRDPALWADLVERHRVTLWNTVPALAEMLVDEVERHPEARPSGLRLVMMSGDWIPVTLPGRIRALWEDAEIISMGGATEASIWSILYPIRQVAPGWPSIPYGRPMWNQTFHVLDTALQPSPVGVPGQLFIGGTGVALGYWRDGEKTRASFLMHPRSGERLYRTGDLGRYLADGTIEFLGRADQQVKIRGFRIELGEIESALSQHPEVGEALAIVRDDRAGEKRLVAYVVPALAVRPPAADLRAWVAERLPEYMVPGAFVLLDTLPLTANGKVDRKALPAPEWESAAESRLAPRTPVEEVIAGIWAQVLQLEQVGATDHFFDLGGHSLLAAQVVSRLHGAFGVEIPLRDLFEAPVLADLAARIEAMRRAGAVSPAPPLTPLPRKGPVPLSFAQQRLWFLHQIDPLSPAYHLHSSTELRGPLDVTALDAALSEVVRRHEALRTGFEEIDGQPVQVVAPARRVPLALIDLTCVASRDRLSLIRVLAVELAALPFHLDQAPLLRACLVRLDSGHHAILLTVHHIVSDGWSMELMIYEMKALYRAFVASCPSPLPELQVQYTDFAFWQRSWLSSEVMEPLFHYWKSRLAGAPALLELPLDRKRPLLPESRGAVLPYTIPQDLSDSLRGLAREQNATLFMVLLAAFKALLHGYSGQEDMVVGTNVAGRASVEVEGLIGFFINMLALRTDLSGDPAFRELLRRVRETTLDAYSHQELPFVKLVDELRLERSLSHTPLFQAVLTLQPSEASGGLAATPDLTLLPIELDEAASPFDLIFNLSKTAAGVSGSVIYNVQLFEAATITRLMERYSALLRKVAAAPERRLSEIREALFESLPGEREREFGVAARRAFKSVRRQAVAIEPKVLV